MRNIAHLVGLSGHDLEAQVYLVQGYRTPNDGGGGLFYYDPADSSTATNRGTVFASAGGRRFKRLVSGAISIKEFGASQDGRTDDAPAIQDAFDWALANGVALYIPGANTNHKFYRCAEGLMITFTTAGTSLRVYGDGVGSYLFFTCTNGDCLTIDSTMAHGSSEKTTVAFEDFAIGGSRATRDGLVLRSGGRGSYWNFWVTGVGRHGISLRGSLLNLFAGGGVNTNIGSPGNVAQGIPLAGVFLDGNQDNAGANGNTFSGFKIEGVEQAATRIDVASNTVPIGILSPKHGYHTGDVVAIGQVVGNTTANGAWRITVVSSNAYTLDGSAGNGAYVSGGTAVRGVGFYATGRSYGNLYAGGTCEDCGVAVFLDSGTTANLVLGADLSGTTVATRDRGINNSFLGNVPGANAILGNRVDVHGDDLSTFLAPGHNQLAIANIAGAAKLFSRNSDPAKSVDLRLMGQNRGAVIRFLVNGSNDGTGGREVGVLYQSAGRGHADFPHFLQAGSDITSTGGNLVADSPGKGLQVKEGPDARMGRATLSAGIAVVDNHSLTANTRIFLSYATADGTAGSLYPSITPGASFTIHSTSSRDTNLVNWLLVEPAP